MSKLFLEKFLALNPLDLKITIAPSIIKILNLISSDYPLFVGKVWNHLQKIPISIFENYKFEHYKDYFLKSPEFMQTDLFSSLLQKTNSA